jgi:hypothetical protein
LVSAIGCSLHWRPKRSGRSGSRSGGARAWRPVRASRLQARIALTPDHRPSSYAHELGSQERKLGHIEQAPDIRGWVAGLAALGPRRAGGSTSTRATSAPGAGPGRVTGQGAARLSPSPGLAAGQATQVVSHGRHHHNRFSVASVPSFSGLNARAGSPQNRHSGPPSARASIHPDMWHRPGSRPTCGCVPHDTGPSRCSSTPMSSSTATASCCSTRPGPGVGHPTRATPPAPPPNPLRPPRRALRHRPRRYAHRPAGGHRLRPRRCANCGAVPSPPRPHRRAAGVRTPPGGTDLALAPLFHERVVVPVGGQRGRPGSLRCWLDDAER